MPFPRSRRTATDDQLALVLQRWQKSLVGAETSVWYSFDELALAMKVPADMEFTARDDSYTAENDRLSVALVRWDQVGGPELEDLCALAAASEAASAEVSFMVEHGGFEPLRSLSLRDLLRNLIRSASASLKKRFAF